MNPITPMTLQQEQKRKNTIALLIATTGIAIAIISYSVVPEEEQEAPPAAAAEAPPNGETTKAAAAETALSTDPFLRKTEGKSETSEEAPSADELAKLPAWQAAFSKLSLADRQAFAIAFTKAKEAYSKQHWIACLALLNDCTLIFDGSPNVWNLRACALLENDTPDEAESHIKRALELNPYDSVARMCQSELLMLRRDYQGSIALLQQLRDDHEADENRSLYDTFTFHQLLCHLMLRQEMEARALVADYTPLTDSPLYYYSQAAFLIYQGDNEKALEPLQSATTVYGNERATSSYRKWLNKCGLSEKYARGKRN